MKRLAPKLALFVVVVLLFVAFRHFGFGDYFTLASLKAHQADLVVRFQQSPVTVLGLYTLLYVLMAAVALPGATVLTLAGGAVFGVVTGTIVVSFASTIGATCALLVSRFLLRDFVARRFGKAVAKIDEGMRKEGAFYLFSLRLIPIFPFFLVNLAMGLTRIDVRTFFWVSQVGMLLATIAYVNAGTQLARIDSLRGVLSPSLLLSFAFLGVLPFLAKRAVEIARRRKTLGRFKKPKQYDYNVVVVGAGSAGLVAAYIAATVRAKVALIERHKMGGDCLNTGCVPSKALIRAAKVLGDRKRAQALGFDRIDAPFDFAKVMDRIQDVVRSIAPHDSVERYTKLGVECHAGTAKILSPYEVAVNGRTLTTKNIIVATGARPLVPSLPGLEGVRFLTSDTLWTLRQLPQRLVVLGGGPIGCELAQCFARFGSQVTIVEKGPRLLAREDDEVSALLTKTFAEEGVTVATGHTAVRVVDEGGAKKLLCEKTGELVHFAFDEILLALGRQPNTAGFGLEELGVTLSPKGTIATDDFLRTNFPNIFVCGDVAGPFQFTHTASHQAWYAAVNALFGTFRLFKADYRVIPWVTFTAPEVARVGLSEREAREQGIDFAVAQYGVDDLDRALADREAEGFVKVLTARGTDRILGATIVATHASDMLPEFVTAMKHGLGLNKILGTIHVYPTFSEANRYAAGAWKKAHAPEGALRRLAKFHAWRRNERRWPL